jgi:hypothetical protein
MNFRPGSLPRLFVCHFPEGRVLCLLTNDRVLHDRIAELVNDCSDGEYATKSFIQARVGHLLETSTRVSLWVPLTTPVDRRSARLVQRMCGSDAPDQTPLRQEPLGDDTGGLPNARR